MPLYALSLIGDDIFRCQSFAEGFWHFEPEPFVRARLSDVQARAIDSGCQDLGILNDGTEMTLIKPDTDHKKDAHGSGGKI
ncbi:MAG: hypothetical protein IPP74_10585 [Alphaproteobacteria bacterium]|nr:hypothetical protein [Alphaproteobacteria bacterium]